MKMPRLSTAALAFILSTPVAANIIIAQPHFTIDNITFTSDVMDIPANQAFSITSLGEFQYVLGTTPDFRLHHLFLEENGTGESFMTALIGDLLGFEGDVKRVGPGWFTSSIGSAFPFPEPLFKFTGAEISPYQIPVASVPEPATLLLMGIGLLTLVGVLRKRI